MMRAVCRSTSFSIQQQHQVSWFSFLHSLLALVVSSCCWINASSDCGGILYFVEILTQLVQQDGDNDVCVCVSGCCTEPPADNRDWDTAHSHTHWLSNTTTRNNTIVEAYLLMNGGDNESGKSRTFSPKRAMKWPKTVAKCIFILYYLRRNVELAFNYGFGEFGQTPHTIAVNGVFISYCCQVSPQSVF